MKRSRSLLGGSIGLLLALGACDEAPKVVTEAKKAPPPAPVAVEAAYAVEAKVDLEGIATLLESGEVESAVELEADLNARADGLARVDIDADGELDEIRIVETREEKTTTFEVHAIPSSVAEVTAEAAPIVATIELRADAVAGQVQTRVALDASFKAVARIEGRAEVTRTLGGIAVDMDGRLEITREAKPFVAWAFEAERPRYVATVFVATAVKPEPDPCWPPGHCKHDLWKATGEEPPGHEKRDDAEHGNGAPDHDDRGKGHEKADKKADKKVDKKPDEKAEKKPDKKSDEKKPDKKSDEKAEKKPEKPAKKVDEPKKKDPAASKGEPGGGGKGKSKGK